MIHVTKEEGKYLNQVAPSYVVKTVHGRHYYAVECPQVKKMLMHMDNKEKIVSTYPEVSSKNERRKKQTN